MPTVGTATQRPRPGPRRSLSDAEILAAALRLLDRGGATAVSVRSVAAEVGVAPNALYTYFPTKAELIRAMIDGLLGGVDHGVLVDASLPWRERVTRFALAVRALLLAHPGSVPLLLSSPFDGPNAVAVGERLLGTLADAGLVAADASRASYLLMTYVLGTVALDVAELEPGAANLDETARTAMRRAGLTHVSADTHPRTAASADVIAAYNSTDQFRWGLERLLDGVIVMVQRADAP